MTWTFRRTTKLFAKLFFFGTLLCIVVVSGFFFWVYWSPTRGDGWKLVSSSVTTTNLVDATTNLVDQTKKAYWRCRDQLRSKQRDSETLPEPSVCADPTGRMISGFDHDDGVGVRLLVETGSGGATQCPPPRLSAVDTKETSNRLILRFMWRQRGCASLGDAEFNFVLTEIGQDGVVVTYNPTPERPLCYSAKVEAGGELSDLHWHRCLEELDH
jgi:hypothetical protein